ncbi:hypothetical protein JCM15519_04490 [Fundidesulfovibrio butyratiphilus]
MLTPDIRWAEQYVSAGLNRKFAGVLPAGVVWGYEVDAPGGMLVRVWPGDDPDYPDSVALVDRDGYSLTVRQSGEDTVDLTGRAGGTVFIVLEALYAPNQDTVTSLQAVTTPADHHVVLATIMIPAGATAITADMITFDERTNGNPATLAMSYAASLMAVMTSNMDLNARLSNLEAWAESKGYDASVLY